MRKGKIHHGVQSHPESVHNASGSGVDHPPPDNNAGKASHSASTNQSCTTSSKSISKLPVALSSPVRLEFTVTCTDVAMLSYSQDEKHTKTEYKVYLRHDSASIYKPVDATRAAWVPVVNKRGFNFTDGSPIVITYHNGRFDVGIRGTNASAFSHDFERPSQTGSWYVSLSSKARAKWNFY